MTLWAMKNKLEKMWNQVVVAQSELLAHHLPARTEGKKQKPQSGL
jgi:hypothetical protein